MADSSRIRDFPPEFLWGSSTAAHQVEGNNTNNDWWEWEHRAGSPVTEPSLDAIDHYHRYGSDFAMLAQLGQNAHRLSLEWARIEPEPGHFSRAALEHYRRVLAGLAEHRLTGVVTLQHFSLPRWLAERGGWLAPGAVDHFARYAARVAEALGDLMPWVGTINEPNVNGWLAYLAGAHPPGRIGQFDQWARAGEVARAAHRAAVTEFKAGSPASRIGLCLGSDLIVP